MTRFQKKAMKLRINHFIKKRSIGLSWLSQSALGYLDKGGSFVVDFEKCPIGTINGWPAPEYVRTYGIYDRQGNRVRGFGRITFNSLRDSRLIRQVPLAVEKQRRNGRPEAKVYKLIGNS